VILAGRNLQAATAAAAATLTRALVEGGADILVVAASTIAHTRDVATAALDAGADCFDVQISSTAKQAALHDLSRLGAVVSVDGATARHKSEPFATPRH